MPVSTRRPARVEHDDDDVLRQAGIGSTGPSPVMLIVIGAVVLIALVFIFSSTETPPAPRDAGVPPPPPPPPVVTTTTATTATATITEAPDGRRPTIAGPDAPEDVKRAERLLKRRTLPRGGCAPRPAARVAGRTTPRCSYCPVRSTSTRVGWGPALTMANQAIG